MVGLITHIPATPSLSVAETDPDQGHIQNSLSLPVGFHHYKYFVGFHPVVVKQNGFPLFFAPYQTLP